ncbi:two pore domain potassium channel family protein [Halostella litorea]|uniref:two pore domain potassium channel family protein n=1 Tax=Halostella litorea TaxID=2528831 RepID=UPI001091A3D5|nr:two pore domain potassium channel family protein [Halostella litorea]
MRPLYLVLGVVILVVVVVDILWTTLWVDGGAGPLSSRLSTWVWHGLRAVGGNRTKVLSLSGPIILVVTLVAWVGLLWAGWTLVFAGGESSLIDARSGGPLGWTDWAWYVAYTMFTDGNGDFTPNGGVWQMASSLTTASGMLFVTLGVSYVLSILGAVADKRAFAKSVTGIGDRGEAFVRAGWDGEGFRDLDLPLNEISSDLGLLAEQHKSYPILHYYHSEDASDSSPLAVAVLDEALTVLEFGVPDDEMPNAALVKSARSSTEDYLETLTAAFIQPADETPPPPALDRLREADVPMVPDGQFDESLAGVDDRRRKLLAAVEADAVDWPPADDE